MEKLKAIRAGNRAAVTKLLTKFDTIKTEEDAEVEEVRAIADAIKQKQKTLLELNEKIVDCLTEENIVEEISGADEYMFLLDCSLREIQKFAQTLQSNNATTLNVNAVSFKPSANTNTSAINQIQIPQYQPGTSAETYTEPLPSSFQPQTNNTHNGFSAASLAPSTYNHRLPKLDLPHFNGDVLEWTTFWDSYESTIHFNINLTPIQKFSYLKSQLHGTAAQTIAGFSLTNANYDTAVNLLRERYGKPHKIIHAYMKALMDLSPPTNTLTSLRYYGDQLESYIRGLEALGQCQEMYGALLVPIILSKLPVETRKNIARDYGSDNINLNNLRKAITKEVDIMEAGHLLTDDSTMHTTATFLAEAQNKPHSKPQVNQNKKVEMKNRQCVFCSEIHFPGDCKKVTEVNLRVKIVKEKQLCYNCLGHHRVADCKSKSRCKKCTRKHHTSLCEGKIQDKKSTANKSTAVNVVKTAEETETTIICTTQQHTSVLLKTAIAPVVHGDHSVHANILFDEGAQRSFISKKLANELHVKSTGKETIEMSTFGNMGKNVRHLETTTIQLQTDNGDQIAIHALIVPDIAVPLQNQVKNLPQDLKYLKGLKLAHPINNNDNFEIELLIGADYYWEIVQDAVIRGSGPTAVKSRIGYLLSGPIKSGLKTTNSSVFLNAIYSHHIEEADIEKFWSLESIGIRPPQQDEDDDFLKTYQQNAITFQHGQYTAKLPWKMDHPNLPSNYNVVKARTENTIRRLSREPLMLQKYSEIIDDQLKRGFIEKMNDKNDKSEVNKVHYIPHHPVKKESTTTPIRIVYDCSCKQSQGEASLNDCLMSTPPALNDLTNILMRFRTKKYAISTDIEKAFLHIGLDESDRDVTRFLWLTDPNDTNSPLTTYRFKSILFGATCSPFILNATLAKHLDGCSSEIANTMKNDLYVDNILSSVENEEDTTSYFQNARTLMSKAGFNLRSWSSNSLSLRKYAETENVLEKDNAVKILGLKWNTVDDTITFQRVKLFDIELPNITKREILSQSSRIYDPLGVLSPVSVRAKILMQELWQNKFEWDDPLPLNIQSTWMDLAYDLEKATHTELQRQYTSNASHHKHELHVFVDASQNAYGAAVYICNQEQSSLVIAKNRVAPLKQLTLPQLELMAALVGVRLAEHVTAALQIEEITFWSDSQIVLQWLSTSKQLKKFIRNRVQEIQEKSKPDRWRYCPTKENPADLLTRGLTASQLENNQLWFNGPTWLVDKTKWPKWKASNETILLINADMEESSTTEVVNDQSIGIHRIMNIDRYSSLQKLLRITSYVLRFIRNCTYRRSERNSEKFATTEELHTSIEYWIRSCQQSAYSEEFLNLKLKDSKRTTLVKQLKLYVDGKEIIRCGGRIHNAPVKDETKFPILLPTNHSFTKLVVFDMHENVKHAGALSTITQVRQTYWIPRIRQYVKSLLRTCVTCRKICSRPYTAPDPPPLPKDRLLEAPPFTVTGVDFTGALYVRDKHGPEEKVFICLFTCASTRAVHLEIVTDLTENSFLQAFRRFASRKSLPMTMISDNASTYLAASETLRKLTISPTLNGKLSSYGTNWKFIPKRAPWYGGWWERLIGLTKTCLRKILGRSFVTLETIQTIVTEIEAIINDRPLTYLSSDIQDQEPLTPSHLLYGRRIISTPYPQNQQNEISLESGNDELSKRFQLQSNLIDNFWKRWKSEYVTSLREHHRQTGGNCVTIQVGDVVQIQDDKLPRNRWNIAVVEELLTGNDGYTRAAVIRTKTGRTSRPIVKLFPLEIRTNFNSHASMEDLPARPQREASIRARENIKKWT